MKKMTLAILIGITIFSLVLTAVKTRPVNTNTIDKKDCCKASCPQQKPAEEKKGNTGLIFWDTYSSQLLMMRF